MKRTLKHSLLACALLATLATPIFAARGQGMEHGFGPWSGLSQAKSSLNLSAEQSALFTAAEAASNTAMETMRANHQKMKSVMDEQKAQTVLDLQKLSDSMENLHEAGRAAHDKARDAWLKAYASLSTAQKQTASDYIKQQWAKHAEHFRGGHGPRDEQRPPQ